MNRHVIAIATIGILVSSPSLSAGRVMEVDEHIIGAQDQLIRAVNRWDVEEMLAARGGFERLLDRGGRDWLIRYYIGLADYRIAVYYMQETESEKMDPYLEDAEQHLSQSIDEEPDFSDSFALLAAILSLKIARNPISGIWIGPRIGGIMEEAKKLNPENPRMWLIEGTSAYYRPKMFGGGIDAAKAALRNSIACFSSEEIADQALPSWGASEAFAWLGAIEMENGELDSARVHFGRALAVNPSNGWVEFGLMPRLNELSGQ